MPATINLGDIVALNAHPYFENARSVVISGDSQLLSPLMIVIEIIRDTKDQYDEKTGEIVSQVGRLQCKCIWYSHKSHQFEEAWISSRNLKLIKSSSEANLSKETFGKIDHRLVCLKTQDLETGKYKSSLTKEDSSKDGISEPRSTISSLQAFVGPVMEVIQIMENKANEKENQFDVRTGQKKRLLPSAAVKCKWFNPLSDKLSEKIFPIEALKTIPIVTETHLEYIENLIEEKEYIYTTNVKNSSIESTIIKPLQIFFRNGRYLLLGYDYSLNKKRELNLPLKQHTIEKKYWVDSAPIFDFLSKVKTSTTKKTSTATTSLTTESVTDELITCILTASKNRYALRIKYLGQLDKISYKTIYAYSILPKTTKKEVFYLDGKNVSDDSERTFRSDRILKIEVLKIKF